jgi:hypothetical protein
MRASEAPSGMPQRLATLRTDCREIAPTLASLPIASAESPRPARHSPRGGERRPDDYEVRYDGGTVGRIYRMRSTRRQCGSDRKSAYARPRTGPNGGVADTS